MALAATACGASSGTSDDPARPPHVQQISARQQQTLAAADAAFARALWSELASRDGNVVVSPASIATAVQMAYVGARGETAVEIARVLHLDAAATPTDVAAAAASLLTRIEHAAGRSTSLSVADQVWVQRGFPIASGFRAALADGFDSAFHLADFIGHGEDARRAINDAIAGQTHDRIRDLLPPGTDLQDARLMLTNAIYLNAAWETPFDPRQTAPEPFTRSDGRVTHPKTMSADGQYDYAAAAGYQAIRLPYAGGRLAMTLLLPSHGRSLTWPAAPPSFRPRAVDLMLPKFHFSWGGDLAELLGALGMPTAFTDSADFGGISSKPLHIGTVPHKAFIAVGEKGTEAAAATAVGIMAGTAVNPGSITRLHFDRPFLFRIDDTATGLPLFLGKVADPTLGA